MLPVSIAKVETKSKQIEHVQFVSTLSKGRKFVQQCCRNRQHCCQNGNNVEATFCQKNRSTCIAFEKVASTLLLVWTGLKGRYTLPVFMARGHGYIERTDPNGRIFLRCIS